MEWTEYINTLMGKCQKLRIPAYATFELTPFCNFNCNMCYIRLTPDQAKEQGTLLSTNQWLDIAKEAKSLGTIGLEITGGEAVTRSDFSELYEAFIRMGFIITIRTNGYLLRNKTLELLKKYKPRCVSITLYGGTDETYQKICGIADGFSVVTQNIFSLRDAGINVRLTATMTKDNIEDSQKLTKWAIDNRFYISFYGGLITPIRAAKRSIDHLKVDYLNVGDDAEIELPAREIQNREKYMQPFWMCKGYGTKYCIGWDGRMTLCNTLPSIYSDVVSQSLSNAYKALYEQLDMVKRPAECYDCQYIDYCGACPARFLSESGNHEVISKNLCRIAKTHYLESKGYNLHNNYSKKIKQSESFEVRSSLNEN